VFLDEDRMMGNVQKHNFVSELMLSRTPIFLDYSLNSSHPLVDGRQDIIMGYGSNSGAKAFLPSTVVYQ
jgi:hypothetical protein